MVNVASEAHYRVDGIDFEAVREPTKTRTGFHEYSVSKLANVLHAQELARRLDGDGVTTYSLHPGVIASDIWRSVPWPIRPLMKLRMRSTEDGAEDFAVLRHVAGRRAGERRLLRGRAAQGAGPGGDAAARRRAAGAHDRLAWPAYLT